MALDTFNPLSTNLPQKRPTSIPRLNQRVVMKICIWASVAVVAALSTPVSAQTTERSGGKLIVGGIVGVDSVETEVEGFSEAEQNIMVGATIGYDFETDSRFVFGAEVEYTDSSVGVDISNVALTGDRFSVNAGRDLYAGLRLGYRTGNDGLLYLKAGYTDASIEGEYFDGVGTISDELSFGGVRFGAGGEIDFSSDAAIRLEYRYSDYGELTILGVDSGAEVSRHQLILTLLGKF